MFFNSKKLRAVLEKKLERRQLREEKRKAIRLKRLADREADEMNQKIATEEKLLLITQRKLEAIHLLGELFTRIKVFNVIIFGVICIDFKKFQAKTIANNNTDEKSSNNGNANSVSY